jgi:hypothetical protein
MRHWQHWAHNTQLLWRRQTKHIKYRRLNRWAIRTSRTQVLIRHIAHIVDTCWKPFYASYQNVRHHPSYKQLEVKTNRTSFLMRKLQRTSQYGIVNVKTNNNSAKWTTLPVLIKTGGELKRNIQHRWTIQETNEKYEQHRPHEKLERGELKRHRQHWWTIQETNEKYEQHRPHEKLGRGELKRHRQHWWTIQEANEKYEQHRSHEKLGRVNSRDTDNIDEQLKKQTKNMSNTGPMKN